MVINLCTYNIWDVRAFGLLGAILEVQKGDYDIMILNETKIHDGVYFWNWLGCGNGDRERQVEG